MQGLLQGRLAEIPLEQIDHGAAEVARVAFKGLEADAAEGAPHRLRIPEQLPSRPGQHAHWVVPGLNQPLLEAVLLQVGVGLQTDEEDRRLHLVGPEDALQLAVIGHGLPDRFGALIDDIERVIHRHVLPETGSGQQAAVLQHGAQVVAHPHLAHELLGA